MEARATNRVTGARRVLAAAGALVLALLGWAGLAIRSDAGPPKRGAEEKRRPPNLLLIVTDDQRATNTLTVMPETRRLFAGGGTTFTNAWATTPVCGPSRASIFTGRLAHNHGVTENTSGEELPSDETFQRYLNANRYRTGLFGKYINGVRGRRSIEHFDTSFLGFDRDHAAHAPGQDAFVARKARRFIERSERRDGRPWLAVVAFHSPHSPFRPEPEFADAEVPGPERTPAVEETDFSDKNRRLEAIREPFEASRRRAVAQQRMLLAVDRAVGGLYERVGELGEDRRTLGVFTSDNGFLWGEHGLGFKNLPYPDSARVPLLARWPGRIEAGAADNRLVANIDIAPTFLDAAGLSLRGRFDGRSLLRSGARDWLLLEGPRAVRVKGDTPLWRESYVNREFQYFRWRQRRGIREELYDLSSDPWQLENAASTSPRRVAIARERIARARDCRGPARCP